MKKITIQGVPYWELDISEIATKLSSILIKKAQISWVTDHWTAGSYETKYKSYQFNISPTKTYVSTKIDAWENHGHTWKRNTGNVGLSYLAMASSKFPVTESQMEQNALIKAVLKEFYGLDWSRFVDHADWAKLDGYSHLRWDTALVLPAKASYPRQTITDRTLLMAQAKHKTLYKKDIPKMSEKNLPPLNGPDTGFKDVPPSHWSAEAVKWITDNKLMVGRKKAEGGIHFDPKDPMSREELAVVLHKFSQLMESK